MASKHFYAIYGRNLISAQMLGVSNMSRNDVPPLTGRMGSARAAVATAARGRGRLCHRGYGSTMVSAPASALK